MTAQRDPFPWALLMAAAAVALATGYSIGDRQPRQPLIRASDEPLVNRALDIYGHGKVSREDLRKTFDLAVVYLPKMTCVGFNLKPGTAGGDETMCLDASGRVVLFYRNGD